MLTLIRQARVFAPRDLGRMDVLVAGEKIVALAPHLESWSQGPQMEVIPAGDYLLTPGLIDQHVHLVGGGGGAGFASRGPELRFSEAMLAGTTTVVGVLGVDQIGRNLESLLAKTHSLTGRGMTAKMYTGGFDWQDQLTGSAQRDIYLVDNVIGAKAAVADKRALQPSLPELSRLLAATVAAGGLTGKAGVLHVHLGDLPGGLELLAQAVEHSGVAITQVVPTHVNRSSAVLEQAGPWLARGGRVDFSTSFAPSPQRDAVKTSQAVGRLLDRGIALDRLTISTDGNSVPTLGGLDQARRVPLSQLLEEVRDLVNGQCLALSDALCLVTSNVAQGLGLAAKGRIAPGCDADLLLLEPDGLALAWVMARGRVMVREGRLADPSALDV